MKRMRQAREAKGMTLPDLAEATGINRHTLGRYENGHLDPSLTRASLVARALGVSLDSLAYGEPAARGAVETESAA